MLVNKFHSGPWILPGRSSTPRTLTAECEYDYRSGNAEDLPCLQTGRKACRPSGLRPCRSGTRLRLEKPTEADGTPAVDDNNPDPQLRKRQLMGLNMLSGLKKDGGEYTGGKIYDPGNGKTYNCSMRVEGDVLKVRGSLDKKGLIGRTMDWFRVK